MPISVPLPRPIALSLLILLLDACGGGSGGGSTSGGSDSQDVQEANVAELTGTLDLPASRVTLQWFDTVAAATRYQIEQQDAGGAWIPIDGVWAAHDLQQGTMTWTGVIHGAATFRVEA